MQICTYIFPLMYHPLFRVHSFWHGTAQKVWNFELEFIIHKIKSYHLFIKFNCRISKKETDFHNMVAFKFVKQLNTKIFVGYEIVTRNIINLTKNGWPIVNICYDRTNSHEYLKNLHQPFTSIDYGLRKNYYWHAD